MTEKFRFTAIALCLGLPAGVLAHPGTGTHVHPPAGDDPLLLIASVVAMFALSLFIAWRCKRGS